MRRLDGASAHMIYNDLPGQYQHTLKIAILDFGEERDSYCFETLKAMIEQESASIPFTRWKILRVPFGINHPYWVQDLEFDISHHVRRVGCPAPGDRRAFCQLVSELYAQTLSKSLPLWTIWVVEGLPDGRVAVVAMLHHAYCDGVGASKLLQRLTSHAEDAEMLGDMGVDPSKRGSRVRLFIRGTLELPLMFLREGPSLISDALALRKVAKEYRREGKDLPPNPAEAPPSALLNAPVGHARTFYYESLDLASFKSVGKHFGVSINDLLLAVVSGALRRYHDSRGLPIDGPAFAAIPINQRTEEQQKEMLGNFIGNGTVTMPVDVADPLERLRRASASAQAMKDYIKDTEGRGLARMLELLPPLFANLMNWAVRRSEGRLSPFGNLMVSNVPGPREHLQLGDHIKISDWLSIGQVSIGIGVNVTAWSYVDQFNICLIANPAVISDGEEFLAHMTASFDEYKELAGANSEKPPTSSEEPTS